jgi:multidrug efflux pump subunit AcrB
MNQISAWAIRHPIPPIMLFVILSFLGIVAFFRMPINNMPDISFPAVIVNVSQPGAAPTEMETQVTQRIEGAVASIGNVKNISSTTSEGSASIFVEFQIGTPVDRAMNDVRDVVSRVRSDLPDGIEEPSVQRIDIEGGAIAYFSVGTTDMTPEQLSWFVDNTIAKRLLAINGVASVPRTGGVSREIRINLLPDRLQALGITAVEVNSQLRQLNLDAPGGRSEIGGAEQAIRVLGGAKTAQALGETRIAVPGGPVVRLSDIAEVKDDVAEIRSESRMNGRPVTAFGVFKAKGASDVGVLKAVQKELEVIFKANPKLELRQLFNSVDYTKAQYNSALVAMVEGAVLAVVVVFFFLRDWRATFVAAIAIPLSAIPTFWLMDMMGFTLNTVSLLALSLVAGILVDDAIVEIENIVRHMRMGKTAYQASIDAADEIGLAVVATSATIIAVFVPVSFMGGISGQYFKQFGLTVSAAVLISLLVARLITPLMAAYTLRAEGVKDHGHAKWINSYVKVLIWSLRHRWTMVGIGIASFLISIGLAVTLPTGFIPEDDSGSAQLNIEMPPGTLLADTSRIALQAATILNEDPIVDSVFEVIGADDGAETRNATLYIELVADSERDETVKEFQTRQMKQLKNIPDARINFASQEEGGGGSGRDVSVMLSGDDPALLEETAHRVVNEMKTVKGLVDPRINGDLQRPEILIKPRFDLAAELGVSVASLSQTIRIATLGDIPQNQAKFSLADRQIPIRVSIAEDARRDISTLENLPVPTASGASVPLKSVADISFGQGPSKIQRYNQSRRILIGADRDGIESGPAYEAIYALPSMQSLPAGIARQDAGSAEFMQEMMSNFVLAMVSGILMVIAVLVLLYHRVFSPLTNLGSLILAPLGAFAALHLTGHAITMPVFIGVLMLFGIVAKNSILLVDFVIEEMRMGIDRKTAIIDAGRKRAQPIVMTTIAMVAGMLPVALSLGTDGSFRAPMAIAVIGGLITSTFLTLLIVPAGFTIVDDFEKWLGPKISRKLLTSDPATGATIPKQGKSGPAAQPAE